MTDVPVSAQEAAGPTTAESSGERPEVVVGAAFAAGLTLALILKRIVR